MEQAALYVRLSEEDRGLSAGDHSESIRNQTSLLLRYAETHGLAVYKIYTDEDYSGADRNRPAFRQLIEDARQRNFRVILVKTLSRFTREMEQAETYLHRKFPEWGIRLLAVVDGTDTGDPAGHKARQLNGLVNEWYLEELSASVRAALHSKQRAGKYLASFALYGYRKDPLDHNHLVPDPETAPVVQRIYALYLAGYGTARIAMVLNAEGTPSPSAYKQARDARYKAPAQPQWSGTSVCNILHNPLYTGDMVQGRHQRAGYKKSTLIRQPETRWVVVPNTHEPLVDREVFRRVQQQMEARRISRPPQPVHRPLARKVRCGGCGGGMMLAGHDGRWQMRCLRNRRDPRVCTPNRIPLDDLEALVSDKIQQHLAQLPPSTPRMPHCSPPDGQARQKAKLEHTLRALYLQRAAGKLPEQDFTAAARPLWEQIQGMEEPPAAPAPDYAPLPVQAAPIVCGEVLTRELADALVDSVTVWPAYEEAGTTAPRKIQITWKF